MKEAGGTYTFSKAELKAIDFQENLKHISKLTFEIGGFFDGQTKYTLEFGEDSIKATISRFLDCTDERMMDKEEVLYALEQLHIGEWRSKYDTYRFGYEVLDGTQWSVVIEYDNGHKPVKIEGDNSYPYNSLNSRKYLAYMKMMNKELK